MSSTLLEANVELVVEVGTFENVDLLERGVYQIKVGVELPKAVKLRGVEPIEPHVHDGHRDVDMIHEPGEVFAHSLCLATSPFTIMYKAERHILDTSACLHLGIAFDPACARDSLGSLVTDVRYELWFHATNDTKLEKVAESKLRLRGFCYPAVSYASPVDFVRFAPRPVSLFRCVSFPITVLRLPRSAGCAQKGWP